MPESTPPPPSAPMLRRLEQAARAAAAASHSPYSNFKVGAAVLAGSGKIYRGTNVENASYGLTQCAERTAIGTAVSAGERRIFAVAVYTPTAAPTAPCGACRQVIHEFGPQATVIGICDSDRRIATALPSLLGLAFGPQDVLPAPGRRSLRQKKPAPR